MTCLVETRQLLYLFCECFSLRDVKLLRPPKVQYCCVGQSRIHNPQPLVVCYFVHYQRSTFANITCRLRYKVQLRPDFWFQASRVVLGNPQFPSWKSIPDLDSSCYLTFNVATTAVGTSVSQITYQTHSICLRGQRDIRMNQRRILSRRGEVECRTNYASSGNIKPFWSFFIRKDSRQVIALWVVERNGNKCTWWNIGIYQRRLFIVLAELLTLYVGKIDFSISGIAKADELIWSDHFLQVNHFSPVPEQVTDGYTRKQVVST